MNALKEIDLFVTFSYHNCSTDFNETEIGFERTETKEFNAGETMSKRV